MKIAILGAGAIGTTIAAGIAQHTEEELLLSCRGDQALALMTTGLELSGVRQAVIPSSRWLVHPEGADLPVNWVGKVDYCIICGKTNSTEDLAILASKLLSINGLALSLQNGISAESILGQKCGLHRVVGAITTHGASRIGPGKTKWAGEGEIIIGPLGGLGVGPAGHSIEDIADLIGVLEKGGLSPRWSEEINSSLWVKLLLNCAINPLAAICGVQNGALYSSPELHEQAIGVMLEAANIGRLSRIDLPGDNELIDKLDEVLQATADNYCSMLQDVSGGRVTEVDAITGEIIRISESLGVPSPLNTQLLALIHGIESTLRIN